MTAFADASLRLAGLAGAVLGWRPQDFWAATPAELAAVFRALAGGDSETAGQAELAALMEQFPDG